MEWVTMSGWFGLFSTIYDLFTSISLVSVGFWTGNTLTAVLYSDRLLLLTFLRRWISDHCLTYTCTQVSTLVSDIHGLCVSACFVHELEIKKQEKYNIRRLCFKNVVKFRKKLKKFYKNLYFRKCDIVWWNWVLHDGGMQTIKQYQDWPIWGKTRFKKTVNEENLEKLVTDILQELLIE